MALFVDLANLAEQLAGESSKLKKRSAIAEAIARVEATAPGADDAGLFALYLAGMPFAEADARRLNAGGALLSRALLVVSGADDAALRAAYRRFGDLGAAAFALMQGQPVTTSLTLDEVAEVFAGMAVARSTAGRLSLVEGLLRRASALEMKYLLKLMLGDMRIGVKQSLVEEAIAVAAGAPVVAVRHAVMLEADLAGAVRRAFAGTLADARMRIFHPLGFMLASPVESPEEAVERFSGGGVKRTKAAAGPSAAAAKGAAFAQDDNSVRTNGESPDDNSVGAIDGSTQETQPAIAAFLEDKYDGIRAQVHCGDPAQPGRVAIYSRSREDVTESFPELEEAFAGVTGDAGGPLIFDGEILGWDFAAGRALPFAVLGQRIGRKRVSNQMRQAIPVVFMAFDLMCAGGELLLGLPLRERRNRLETVVEKLVETVRSPLMVDERARERQTVLFAAEKSVVLPRLLLSPSRLVESAEAIEQAYADARARSNEGVMLKAAESEYQPGRRGLAWAKLKRELATLDVVVTGAEFGHGRRAGILSDYTFAVRGEGGALLNVGKAYSGLTDVEIAEMSVWLMEHTLEDQGHFRTVEPLRVLEVAFNNVMRSERHASGFALRFPRIVRIRTDKPVAEIDTLTRVQEVYLSQVDRPVED